MQPADSTNHKGCAAVQFEARKKTLTKFSATQLLAMAVTRCTDTGSSLADVAAGIGLGLGKPGDFRRSITGACTAIRACTTDNLHTARPKCTVRYMHALHLLVFHQMPSNCSVNEQRCKYRSGVFMSAYIDWLQHCFRNGEHSPSGRPGHVDQALRAGNTSLYEGTWLHCISFLHSGSL